MNTIFKLYMGRFVFVFYDGVLIYSKSLEDHLKNLESVLEIQRENELYANVNATLLEQEWNI